MNAKQTTWLALAGWLIAVLTLGTSGAFSTPAGEPPIPILIGATLPLATFLAAYSGSRSFMELVLSADLRLFAGVQAWRFGGFTFLALYTYDILPALFAWPAAIGDMAVAAAAPAIIIRLSRDVSFASSRGFITWNLLGILDLVVAVSMGVLASGLVPGLTGAVTTQAMGRMPLVMIPAYFVPIFVMLHLGALFQARKRTAVKEQLHPTAAPAA